MHQYEYNQHRHHTHRAQVHGDDERRPPFHMPTSSSRGVYSSSSSFPVSSVYRTEDHLWLLQHEVGYPAHMKFFNCVDDLVGFTSSLLTQHQQQRAALRSQLEAIEREHAEQMKRAELDAHDDVDENNNKIHNGYDKSGSHNQHQYHLHQGHSSHGKDFAYEEDHTPGNSGGATAMPNISFDLSPHHHAIAVQRHRKLYDKVLAKRRHTKRKKEQQQQRQQQHGESGSTNVSRNTSEKFGSDSAVKNESLSTRRASSSIAAFDDASTRSSSSSSTSSSSGSSSDDDGDEIVEPITKSFWLDVQTSSQDVVSRVLELFPVHPVTIDTIFDGDVVDDVESYASLNYVFASVQCRKLRSVACPSCHAGGTNTPPPPQDKEEGEEEELRRQREHAHFRSQCGSSSKLLHNHGCTDRSADDEAGDVLLSIIVFEDWMISIHDAPFVGLAELVRKVQDTFLSSRSRHGRFLRSRDGSTGRNAQQQQQQQPQTPPNYQQRHGQRYQQESARIEDEAMYSPLSPLLHVPAPSEKQHFPFHQHHHHHNDGGISGNHSRRSVRSHRSKGTLEAFHLDNRGAEEFAAVHPTTTKAAGGSSFHPPAATARARNCGGVQYTADDVSMRLMSTGWLLASLMDHVVESYLPDPTQLLTEVDNVDELVLIVTEDQEDLLRRIAMLRRTLSQQRSVLYRKEKMLMQFLTPMMRSTFVSKFSSVVEQYKHILAQLVHVSDRLEAAREILNQANSNFVNQVSLRMAQTSNEMNSKMKLLSQVACVCLPLNIITGAFGMNVTIPFNTTEYPSTLWPFCGICIAMCLYLIFTFPVVFKSFFSREKAQNPTTRLHVDDIGYS